jgi:hypothetical protein
MSLDELKSVLMESLEARGVLRGLKAHIRAHIFNALDDAEVPSTCISITDTFAFGVASEPSDEMRLPGRSGPGTASLVE